MSDPTQVHVGDVVSAWRSGKLAFDIKINGDGTAHVQIYASDPTDMRKSGVILTLGLPEWNELFRVLNETHATLQRMQAAGQFVTLAPPHTRR